MVNQSAPLYSGAGYCTSKPAVPEQINIQLASTDTVVVSFVTYGEREAGDTDSKPVVMFGVDPTKLSRATGVTHHYSLPPGAHAAEDDDDLTGMDASLAHKEARTLRAIRANRGTSDLHAGAATGGRIYQMHFVKLAGLQPRAKYHYTMSSGTSEAVTSDMYPLRARNAPFRDLDPDYGS